MPVGGAEALMEGWAVKEEVDRTVAVAGPPRSVCTEGVGSREMVREGRSESVAVRDSEAVGVGEAVPTC